MATRMLELPYWHLPAGAHSGQVGTIHHRVVPQTGNGISASQIGPEGHFQKPGEHKSGRQPRGLDISNSRRRRVSRQDPSSRDLVSGNRRGTLPESVESHLGPSNADKGRGPVGSSRELPVRAHSGVVALAKSHADLHRPREHSVRLVGSWCEDSPPRPVKIAYDLLLELGNEESGLPTPPPTPKISRLGTPDFAPMAIDTEFCACCGNEEEENRINEFWYIAGRAKMDSQS